MDERSSLRVVLLAILMAGVFIVAIHYGQNYGLLPKI
ncbi:UNVERIFIED_ORG: hypothetical protein GGE63_000091 [Rhizobium esperanzae]